jgi:SAM-dependent methyltransferase
LLCYSPENTLKVYLNMSNYLDIKDAFSWGNSRSSAHFLYEKPAIFSMLPDNLSEKSILSVGCGFGEECQVLHTHGANVIGTDYSDVMIVEAQKKLPGIEFRCIPMERVGEHFEEESFDVIFSSLTLHYSADWTVPLKQFHKVLKNNGQVIFSTHHPVYWGGARSENEAVKEQLLGYTQTLSNGKIDFLGDYMTNRPLTARFGGAFDAKFYHANLSTMLNWMRQSGFVIDEVLEPLPLSEAKEKDPVFYERASRVPLFILFRLTKQ